MAEVECRDCYDFKTHRYKYLKECLGGDDFTYGDIFYCRWQIIWVIKHSVLLKSGVWPDMPHVTGEPIGKRKQTAADYERACITHADVDYRLKKTKGDGKLLKKEIELGTPINEMDEEAESALLWCEGWRKKRGDYAVWKAKKTYRQRRGNCERTT